MYIVDPFFRQQFQLASPTPRYQAVLGGLPDMVVASAPQLQALISFLCEEVSGIAARSVGRGLELSRRC